MNQLPVHSDSRFSAYLKKQFLLFSTRVAVVFHLLNFPCTLSVASIKICLGLFRLPTYGREQNSAWFRYDQDLNGRHFGVHVCHVRGHTFLVFKSPSTENSKLSVNTQVVLITIGLLCINPFMP